MHSYSVLLTVSMVGLAVSHSCLDFSTVIDCNCKVSPKLLFVLYFYHSSWSETRTLTIGVVATFYLWSVNFNAVNSCTWRLCQPKFLFLGYIPRNKSPAWIVSLFYFLRTKSINSFCYLAKWLNCIGAFIFHFQMVCKKSCIILNVLYKGFINPGLNCLQF